VHIAGVTANPTGEWVTQQARNVIGILTERAEQLRFLIHDRDTKFAGAFDEVFRSMGLRVIRTPVRTPRANAVMERWFGTLRRECLDRLLIVGRHHYRPRSVNTSPTTTTTVRIARSSNARRRMRCGRNRGRSWTSGRSSAATGSAA
jgi:transposase InsO family protein